jgi:hypothetical protein
MLVMTYNHFASYLGPRQFSGWSAAHEISFNNAMSFNTCGATPSFSGRFDFYVR